MSEPYFSHFLWKDEQNENIELVADKDILWHNVLRHGLKPCLLQYSAFEWVGNDGKLFGGDG